MGLKSSYSRLARLFEKSRDTWRAKAIARRKENRLLELKVRDLEISRAKWKERALTATDAQKRRTDKAQKVEKEGDDVRETGTALAEISPSIPPACHHCLRYRSRSSRSKPKLRRWSVSEGLREFLSCSRPFCQATCKKRPTTRRFSVGRSDSACFC